MAIEKIPTDNRTLPHQAGEFNLGQAIRTKAYNSGAISL
jgi:hypothetical protein